MNDSAESSSRFVLGAAAVHVWRISLRGRDRPADPQKCISAGERARAGAFRNADARRRFIATRAALRGVLSRYAGRPADELVIAMTERGKPLLAGAQGLHFSISHARELAVIALARAEVGVDVEHIRTPRHIDRICARVLHPETAALLAALPPAQRVSTFLDAWTQREAHVKAVGGGLFHTPDSLPFEPAEGRTGTLHHIVDRVDHSAWSVARFEPASGTRGAVAVAGVMHDLTFFDWDGAEHD